MYTNNKNLVNPNSRKSSLHHLTAVMICLDEHRERKDSLYDNLPVYKRGKVDGSSATTNYTNACWESGASKTMIFHSRSILSNYIFYLFIEVQSKWWSDFIERMRNPGPSARCSRSTDLLAIFKTHLESSKQPQSVLASLPSESQNIINKENMEIQVSMHLMLLTRK